MKLSDYSTIAFDCDGVLLNSNKVKTKAFYESVISYGEAFAKQLVAYHRSNGGVSRYKKFDYFLREIVSLESYEHEMNVLLEKYAELVREGLLKCEVAGGLKELKSRSANAKWMVVSGGDQVELREIFAKRNLSHYFEAGIYGSPESKEVIIERGLSNGLVVNEALFIGDSRYDHEAACSFGIDFVFVHGWTEFDGWREYCAEHSIGSVGDIRGLLSFTGSVGG